jgi:organic hydroperoxide reductase OsmC/OhrA
MATEHQYELTMRWTGNTGSGTSDYRSFARDHTIDGEGKPAILGTADPAFRGDASRWNPEELLVAALAQCHMLWYLHLCAGAGVVVIDYIDSPVGTLTMDAAGGGGQFSEVVLRPAVTVAAASMVDKGLSLHAEVDALCFIARSVNFAVHHEPSVTAATVAPRTPD